MERPPTLTPVHTLEQVLAMARNKSTIPPFPADIDRDHFGSWLSGFTDGEGSFTLGLEKRTQTGVAQFVISLRNDDSPVLSLVQSYWMTGCLFNQVRHNGQNPQTYYYVYGLPNLVKIVIPHFERYPLLAKKKRDFAIWKEAVEFMYAIYKKPRVGRGNARGIHPKWNQANRDQFIEIRNHLHATRQYNSDLAPVHIEKQCEILDTQGHLF